MSSLNNDSSDHRHRDILHGVVKNAVQYINDNGGWTCIGWIRTSGVHNESDTTGAMIANNKQEPHIVYLFPMDTNLPAATEFKDLQYDQANFNETTTDDATM